jgi:hypothetical protein
MKTLVIWDFDDTIIRTPGPESFKYLLDQNIINLNDINNNRFTFWNNPLSLDTNYFQLVAKKPAIDFWNYNFKNNYDQILITNRSTNMLSSIENILNILNIHMSGGLYSGSDNTGKINVLKKIIEKNNYNKFIFIEDSIYNLQDYQNFMKKYNFINYELYFINTHSMCKIEGNLPKLSNYKDVKLKLIN